MKELAAILLILISAAAHAEVPLGIYQTQLKGANSKGVIMYLTGVARGIDWANADATARKNVKLFCLPDELPLDKGVILAIFRRELEHPADGVPYTSDKFIEEIMLTAFTSKYPCK